MKQKSVISSLSNAQIKNLSLLQTKAKAREEQGLFVIEGIKMYDEAKLADIIVKAYVSESFYMAKVEEIPNYFETTDYEIITDSVLKEIAETKTPQGVLATVRKQQYKLEDLIQDQNPCLLLLEDIRDPGNLGTILRTAEGAGVTGAILNKSCVDIYNPKVIRSTMGSIYRVPYCIVNDFNEVLKQIKKNGITLFAAHLSGKSYDTEGNFRKKCALLIGNEANGLSKEASEMSDELIRIPMAGKVESLNAAVAAAILMYEVARQRKMDEI